MPKKPPTSIADRLPVPIELIERRIYLIRGQKVMLDSHLAELYGVTTKVLNQAVKRNRARFPCDFRFRLTQKDAESLRSQSVTLDKGHGRNSKYAPLAFTEHGVAMLSAVLNSQRAVQMSVLIVRAFVKMRELLASHKDLAARVEKLEGTQKKHGSIIGILAEEIDEMKLLPEPPHRLQAQSVSFARP